MVGKIAFIGADGNIESGDIAYDKSTNTLSVANLNVTGTTSSVSTTNTTISDKVITLNKGGASVAGQSGLLIEDGTNGALTYNDGVWRIGTTSADGSGDVSTTPGTLMLNTLQIYSGDPATAQNLGDYADFIAGLNA